MTIREFFGFGVARSADSAPSKDGQRGASYRSRIEYANGEETSLCVGALFRAAELRASSLASLKLKYQVLDKKQKYMRLDETREGKRTNYVLNVRPNSRQNAFQFWKRVETLRIFKGHAYIYPVFDPITGWLKELVPCTGEWNRFENMYYLVAPEFGLNGKQVPAAEVIVLRGIVTDAHPEGESVIRYAARTLNVSATSEKLALETAAKGGRQKLIIQQKDDGGAAGLNLLDPNQMREHAARMHESWQDYDVMYDDSNGNITVINQTIADMQLLETRKFTVSDIARFTGVPRSLLMDDGNSSYKTPEAASLEFMSRTLSPLLREIEDEFDGKMLVPEEYGQRQFRFDTSGLFALDITTRDNHNKMRLEAGVASVNELRAEMNMPALEGGDEHYVTCNVAPIGSPKLSGDTSGLPEVN